MITYGLIGYPLTHSFSQQYFTKKFEDESLSQCQFLNFSIPHIADIEKLLTDNPTLAGLCVTIPYKEKIIPYCNFLSEEVKKIGAANSIKVVDNQLHAFNTDIVGFEKSFFLEKKEQQNKALILGTGGASKAVQYVLAKNDIEYKVVSRLPSSTTITYEAIDELLLNHYPIIINCTPIGTSPNIDEYPAIPYQYLSANNYLFDLVYNPDKTLFLQKGEEQGAAIKNGYDMLVLQAEESWRIWNDK